MHMHAHTLGALQQTRAGARPLQGAHLKRASAPSGLLLRASACIVPLTTASGAAIAPAGHTRIGDGRESSTEAARRT